MQHHLDAASCFSSWCSITSFMRSREAEYTRRNCSSSSFTFFSSSVEGKYAFAAPPAIAVSRLPHPSESRYYTRPTSTGMMRRLLHPQWWSLDILAFARNLRVVRIVVDHVTRPASTSGVDVLLNGRRGEGSGC